MKRVLISRTRICPLPAQVANICDTGCIYREPSFKHLSCPKTKKTDPCAAPCPPIACDCKQNENPKGLKKYKNYNEVFLL